MAGGSRTVRRADLTAAPRRSCVTTAHRQSSRRLSRAAPTEGKLTRPRCIGRTSSNGYPVRSADTAANVASWPRSWQVGGRSPGRPPAPLRSRARQSAAHNPTCGSISTSVTTSGARSWTAPRTTAAFRSSSAPPPAPARRTLRRSASIRSVLLLSSAARSLLIASEGNVSEVRAARSAPLSRCVPGTAPSWLRSGFAVVSLGHVALVPEAVTDSCARREQALKRRIKE